MNAKMMLAATLAAIAIAAPAAFNEDERGAVRKAVSSAEVNFSKADALDGKAITLLPVKGDLDGYCERLLIGALVNAGKTCVVSNDEKNDERFRRILSEIKWDEVQTTLKSIDPSTAYELGHLKSTQILMEARLDVMEIGRKRRAVAELNLLAYEVNTKQYVWSANIAVDEKGLAWPDPAEFNIKVVFTSVDDAAPVANLVAVDVRNRIAGYGYRVNAEGDVDLELSASFACTTFDKSGGYLVFKGTAAAKLVSKSGDGILYEKAFSAKGKRGLGEEEAFSNLANELSAQIKGWLDATLEPRLFFVKHRDFAVSAGR